MKKCGLFTLVVLLFLITARINTAEAKLTIIPPQDMIEQSTLIVIGTVTKRDYSEQQRQIVISVETVIKGKTNLKEIELKLDKPHMYGWLGFDFPEKGTRIMVLLQQNDPFILTGDTNAVAVVNGNKVRLYKGATMGQFTPERYEETYKAFLDKGIQSSPMPIDKLNTTGDNKIFDAKSHDLKHKTDVLINIALIVGIVLVTCLLLYRIWRRNGKRLS